MPSQSRTMPSVEAPPGQPLLCLPGPENWYKYDGDFCLNGEPIRLVQEGGQGRGTGWCVWDGAVVLAKYMEAAAKPQSPQQQPGAARKYSTQAAIEAPICIEGATRCIELGSGTGLAGLAAAQILQVPTVLTDIDEVQAALLHNIEINPQLAGMVSAQVLDWCSPAAFLNSYSERVCLARGNNSCSDTRTEGGAARAQDVSCCERQSRNLPVDGTCVDVSAQNCSESSENAAYVQSTERDNDARGVPSEDAPSQHELDMLERKVSSKEESVGRKEMHRDVQQVGSSGRLLVLAADCVWVEELVRPFAQTLKEVCSLCDDTAVLFAHKERSRRVDDVMISELRPDFSIENVAELPGESRGSIKLMKLVLKKI